MTSTPSRIRELVAGQVESGRPIEQIERSLDDFALREEHKAALMLYAMTLAAGIADRVTSIPL